MCTKSSVQKSNIQQQNTNKNKEKQLKDNNNFNNAHSKITRGFSRNNIVGVKPTNGPMLNL